MKRLWTEVMLKYMRGEGLNKSYKDNIQDIEEKFGVQLNINQIKACRCNRKISSNRTGRFTNGHVPANKGKKGKTVGRMAETQFKKGQKPINHRPIGSERIDVDGYTWEKVAEPNKWREKHVRIWEAFYGKRPKSHAVIFADGDKQNFDIDNLLLVSRAQLVRMNQNGLIQQDAELTRTGANVANLMNEIGKAKRRNKHDD